MNHALLEPTTDARYSIGAWVGLPITIVIALVLLGFLALGLIIHRSEARKKKSAGRNYVSEDQKTAFWTALISGLALLVTLTIFAFAWWPFHWEYHQWRPVRGEVAQVDARLLGSADGMSEMYVVKYKGSPVEYRCDDSRCASVKVGDVLELTCKRAWQFTGTHGRACSFVAAEAKR